MQTVRGHCQTSAWVPSSTGSISDGGNKSATGVPGFTGVLSRDRVAMGVHSDATES
jgi:hypothetical protein